MTPSGGSIRRNLAPRWAVVAGVVLYLLSRLTGGMWLGLVACALGAVGMCGIVLQRLVKNARVTVQAEPRVVAGSTTQARVVVRNAGRWPLPALRVTHERDGFDSCVVVIPTLRPGEQAEAMAAMRAHTRGVFDSATVSIAVATPLGVLGKWSALPSQPVIVHPAAVPALPAVVGGVGGVLASADRPGRGIDVHGLRMWQRGDAAGSVHWRTSARRGELLVLERSEELGGGFAVLVGHVAPGEAAERAIARAAATAVAAIRDGRRVSLYGPVEAGLASCGDRVAVLDWFARLRGDGRPGRDVAAAAGHAAGWGGTVLWLASEAPPADVMTAVRRCGAALIPVCQVAR